MENILLIGCGFVGGATADLFIAENIENDSSLWKIATLNRRTPISNLTPRARRFIQCFSGDVTHARQFAALVREKNITADVIIFSASTKGGDMAAYRNLYLGGLKNLRECFPDAPILFTGSTSVYGQIDGEKVTEESATLPKGDKGKILLEAESITLASGGWVLRLGGIYGPGRSIYLERFMLGKALPTAKDLLRYVNQIHREDAARAIHFVIKQDIVSGIYNVVDDTPSQLRDVYEWLAQATADCSLKQTVSEIPPDTPRKRPWTNKRVLNKKLRQAGWFPQFASYQKAIPSLLEAR
ncbi:MAG: NAD-dependent epimerase/dehydratase family protein [Chthoniobacterales bacterium]